MDGVWTGVWGKGEKMQAAVTLQSGVLGVGKQV